MTERDLTSEEKTELKEKVFNSLKYVDSVESPELWVTAGQPAAGKKAILEKAIEHFADKGDFVLVDIDEFRQFDARYPEYQQHDDKTAAGKVQYDVGVVTQDLLEQAIKEKKNILLDQTSKDTDWTANHQIKVARDNGYDHIEMHAVATKEQESLLRNYTRYEDEKLELGYGRYVPESIQQMAFKEFPSTIKHLEDTKAVDRIYVYNAQGEIVYDNKLVDNQWEKNPDVVKSIEDEHKKPFTAMQILNYNARWHQVEAKMMNHERITEPTYAEVQNVTELRVNNVAYLTREAFGEKTPPEFDKAMSHIDQNYPEQLKQSDLSQESFISAKSFVDSIVDKELSLVGMSKEETSLTDMYKNAIEYGIHDSADRESVHKAFDSQIVALKQGSDAVITGDVAKNAANTAISEAFAGTDKQEKYQAQVDSSFKIERQIQVYEDVIKDMTKDSPKAQQQQALANFDRKKDNIRSGELKLEPIKVSKSQNERVSKRDDKNNDREK